MVTFRLLLNFFFLFKIQVIFGKAQSDDLSNCSISEYIETNIFSSANLHEIQKLLKVIFIDQKSTASLSLVPKNVCMKTKRKELCCDKNTLESMHQFLSERETIVKGSVSGSILGLLVDPSIGLITLRKKRFADSKKKIAGSNFATVYSKTDVFLGLIQNKIQSVRQEFQSKYIAQAMQPIFSYFETTLCSSCNPAISKMRLTSDTLKIKQDEKVIKKLKSSYWAANKRYFAAYEKLIQEFLSPGGIIDMALLLRNEYYTALLFTLSSHLKDSKYANISSLFDHMHAPISLLQSLYQESLQQEAKGVKQHDFDSKKSSHQSFIDKENTSSTGNLESGDTVAEKDKSLGENSNLTTVSNHEDLLDSNLSNSQLLTKSNITHTKEKLTECLRYVNLIPTNMLQNKQSISPNEHFEKIFDSSLTDLTMKRFLLNFLLAPQACFFDIVLNLLQWLPDPRIDTELIERLAYFKKNPKKFENDSSLLATNFMALVRMCERVNTHLRKEYLLKDQQSLISALESSVKD